ncbi:XRE family transcriptional regulator [Sinorhizobium meliloti]|uniref:helix-turn-helix domain-containing protein n=1 Tax=Rhizobium meliloti TaxID=382 RepID=UPI000B4A359E|nr:helix-turn-helix transcriptional regulator [Sinorhizobium meliloti]ASP84786.1 XRE family transcriptional regulator [Sinorhizobium meliloti]MQW27074.1 helix-turn-helix domain-containing protein [Sinorhizobium meliloti]
MENELAQRIRSRLETVGKSAAAASLEAGLGRSAVTDILSGNSGSPRLTTLEKLADVLECSLAYLVGASDAADPDDRTTAPTPPSLAPKRVPIVGAVQIGVFQEEDILKRSLSGPLPSAFVRGTEKLPDWTVSATLLADDSLENFHISRGDILTIASPPTKEQAIPLRTGMLVGVKRRVAHEGIVEISVRYVKQEGSKIHLCAGDTDEFGRKPRFLTIDLKTVPDEGLDGDPNQYAVSDGRIRIFGIIIRIEREIAIPD